MVLMGRKQPSSYFSLAVSGRWSSDVGVAWMGISGLFLLIRTGVSFIDNVLLEVSELGR